MELLCTCTYILHNVISPQSSLNSLQTFPIGVYGVEGNV